MNPESTYEHMRRVKLFIAWSLDGFIAREDGGVDWMFDDQDNVMTPFMSSVDTVVMGRKTYEVMEQYDEPAHEGMRTIVFSRSRRKGPDKRVEWVSEDASGVIKRLREEEGKDIWVVGGGELFMHLLKHQQIDDVILAIHPIILGAGITLFPPKAHEVTLDLVEVRTHENGLLVVHYGVPR